MLLSSTNKIEKRFDIPVNMVHVVNECSEELVIVVNIYHCEIFYACSTWYVLVWYYVGKVMQSVHLWFTIAYIYHNFFVFPPIDPLISTDNFDFYICMMTTIVFEFGSQLTVTDKFVSYTSLVTGGFFYVYIHRLNWLKAIVHGEIMHKTMQYINQKHVWSKLSQIQKVPINNNISFLWDKKTLNGLRFPMICVNKEGVLNDRFFFYFKIIWAGSNHRN